MQGRVQSPSLTSILIFAVEQGRQGKGAIPCGPASRVDDIGHVRCQVHSSRVQLPRSAQVSLDGLRCESLLQIRGSVNVTCLEGKSCVLLRNRPALRCQSVELTRQRCSNQNGACLENSCSIPKNEVHCS